MNEGGLRCAGGHAHIFASGGGGSKRLQLPRMPSDAMTARLPATPILMLGAGVIWAVVHEVAPRSDARIVGFLARSSARSRQNRTIARTGVNRLVSGVSEAFFASF